MPSPQPAPSSTGTDHLAPLSDEIIQRTMEAVVCIGGRQDYFSCDIESQSLIAITHTNRRLRALALDHGTLWGQILQPDTQGSAEFQVMLERTRGTPLYLTSSNRPGSDEEKRQVWDLALGQVARCKGLILRFETDFRGIDQRPIGSLFRQPMPILSHLILEGIHESSLRQLISVDDNTGPALLYSPFQHLQHLSVRQEPGQRQYKVPAAEWLGILYSLPDLESANLVHAIRAPPYTASIIPSTAECPAVKALPKLRSLVVQGNLQVHTELIKHLPISPSIFDATLFWEQSPQWLDPLTFQSQDKKKLIEGVAEVFKILPRTRGLRRIWTLRLEEKAFAFSFHDSEDASKFSLGVRVTRHGSHRAELDAAFASGFGSIMSGLSESKFQDSPFNRDVLSHVEYMSIFVVSDERLWRDAPFSQTMPLLRRAFSDLTNTHSLYINNEILERGLAPKLLQPTSLERERKTCPFPSVRTLYVDACTFSSRRSMLALADYVLWRGRVGEPVVAASLIVVLVSADTEEELHEALYVRGLNDRIERAIESKVFKGAIARIEVLRVDSGIGVESVFHFIQGRIQT
ncbi:hypothetical protein CC2G_008287 [Coprinopsis cinerea AmutBmut pab1-1]|nr:hypothetical protein CC2G_008287 [Coprinopsis cinerea AmutBmut pab1-1]